MSIEGFWAVNFGNANDGGAGAGVAVFDTQRIMGGDSSYYYRGNYKVLGNDTFNGTVSVIHFAGALDNIFGRIKRVDIKFEGTMQGDAMHATGVDCANPQNTVVMIFRRLDNLA